MTEHKRYEILESLPVYGPMYIPVSRDGEPFYSEGFPVRFNTTGGTQWVANFQTGWTDLKQIIELADTTHLLVIAFGTCYLMDPDQIRPLACFGVGYATVLATEDGRLILQDQTVLTIVEANGNHWSTERISWDGLKELRLDKNTITGLTYNPTHYADDWVPFSYNIDTKEMFGDTYPQAAKVTKKKWRFW